MNTTLPTKTNKCNRRNTARSILINLSILFTLVSLQTSGQISVSGGTGLAATYTSFTNAGGLFAALNTNVQTGNNIVVTISADITNEAGTTSLNAGAWATINITPVGARIVSGTVAGNPMINLNGADNVTFNGLNAGGNSLTISNLSTVSTSGTSTIRFIGGATSNNFTNCSILGSTTVITTTNGGVIFFSTDANTTNGNDNNIFTSCNIGAAGSNLPSKLVFGNGSTGTATIANSGNQFNSCNFSDAFLPTAIWSYINISAGNTDWTFNNNKFYSSATRTQTTGADNSIIRITNTLTGNNFQITNNTFGFANESGTGTFSVAGGANKFSVINVNVATTTATNISNNTISNISHSTTASGTTSSSPFILIYVQGGLTTVNNNTIGSQSATGSITFTSSSTSASDLNLIYNFGTSNWTTNNNTLGGVTVANSSTGAANLFVLRCNTASGVTWTCNNNTIGGTVSNSLQSTSTATATVVRGITTENPIFSCNGNTIRNLSMLAANTLSGTSSSIIGIFHNTSSNIGNTISNNTIHSLANNSATGATAAVGLFYGGATSGTNIISRNLIYNIHLATSSTSGSISGITTNNGLTVYHNNMIRLGFDLSGNSQTVGYAINGINDGIGTNNFFFNSIYIGGTGVVSSSNTFAFNSVVTTNTRVFQNNIFYNGRSNASGTGKNYAIRVGGSAANPSGLTTNYNVVLANETGGVLGLFNSIDRTDLAAWKLATGQDANSLSADPQFLSPNTTTPDLHISSSVGTPIEGAGLAIASVTNDFDGETRSGLTPTDIGADAGSFTSAPVMTYTSSTVTQVTGAVCAGSSNTAVVRLEIVTTGVLSPLTLTNWSINGNGTSNLSDLTNYRIYSTGSITTFNTSNPVSAVSTGLTSSPDVVVIPSSTVTLSTGSNYFWLVYNTNTTATGPNLDGEFTSVTLSSGAVTPTTTAPSGVFTLNVKPTVTLSPSAASYCNPGGAAVTLDAGGALTYTYSPTTALSPTTGATVSATPSTTVTYTVTGTDVNGCTNTAVSTISVLPGISGLSASSTPSIICNGSTTDLKSTLANSSVAKNYTFSSGSGSSLDAMASSTIVVGSGVDDAPMALSGTTAGAAQTIGFTFNFEGNTYTHFSASPDGWIRLTNSTTAISSQATNTISAGTNIPKIAPFWDDIATGTNGNVKIQINGVAPNRIFIVQWFVTIPRNTSGTANSTFQAWLYETSGVIEYRYGTMGVAASASGGLTGNTNSNYQSITFSSNSTSFAFNNDVNGSSPQSGTIYTYTPPTFSYLWNTTASITNPANQNVTTNNLSANETFTVVATSSAGCTASATASVTVSENPAITTQPTNSVKCAGQTATFNVVASGVGLTYQWRKNSVDINTTTNASAGTATLTLTNISASDADNYDVVVSASCGSPVISSSVSLTVNALPVITISATNEGLICNPSGAAVSLTANNANTYAWSPATGLSATNLATVSANPTTTQLYTVTGTDANGCTGSATSTVTVATKPSVSATSTPSTICSGANSQLNAINNSTTIPNYIFSNSTTTYTEITGGTTMGTATDDDVVFNNSTTGAAAPVSGTGFPIGFSFNYNGSTFDKFAISTNGYIVLGTGTFSIANNTTAALSTATTSGFANLIAAWNQDLGGQTGSQIQYLTTGTIGSRILTVQWKGYTRLSNTANLNFQIKLYESSNAIELVYGSNIITSVNSFNGGVGLRGATNATTSTRSTSTNWSATTAGINTSTCTMSNTIVPASGTVFTFSQPSLASYSWSPTTFITSGDELTANPIATGVNANTTYTVTVANASGCTATASTTVTLATPVTITTEPVTTQTKCVGQSATFTVVAVGTSLTYQWRKNSVNIPVGTNGTALNASLVIPSVILTDADVYDVIVTDACNNTATSQPSTLVVNGLPTVTLTTSSPSYYCSPGGTAVTLTAGGASTYSYSPSTGITPTTGSPVAATPTTTTTYTVTGTDENGCTSQASALVTVNTAVQNLSAIATPASICTGGTSSLFANGFIPFTANNYDFTTETEALLDPMTGASTIIGSSVANAPSTIAPIGFNFAFEGNNYTHFSASPDGWLMFGTSTTTTPGNQTGNTITSSTNVPKIYPYWDNIHTGSNGNVKTLITGTSPNRIFKIQWAVNLQNTSTGLVDGTFQAWLYETTGVIEYRYGTMATPGGTVSAGLTGAISTNYESITYATHTVSSTSANDNNAVSPSIGRLYRFTPPSSLTYSWTATTNLVSAASQTTLTNSLNDSETFTVVATAASGCSASASTTVTVSDNPVITTQPAPINSCVGRNVSFTVVTTGIGLTYQWQKGGVDISIGTNASAGTTTLNLNNVSAADNGIYTVVVTSGCGTSVTSNGAATLTVNTLPNVTLSASNNNFCTPGGTPVVLTAGGASTYAYSPTTNLSATTGVTVNASPTVTRTYTVTGADANGCTATASQTLNAVVAPTGIVATATPSALCPGGNSQLNVTVANIPGSGAIKITEVMLSRTGTGVTTSFPTFATGADLVEISNVSAVDVDISSWTITDYNTNSAIVVHSLAFPAGTIIPANSVAIVCLGTGTDDIPNRYFNTGGTVDNYSSGAQMGIVLKNGSTIVDAVGLNSGYVFAAGTGVTATDWSGFAPSATLFAGTIRSASGDGNTGADWIQSSVGTPQTIGTYNGGYSTPTTISSYAWTPATFISSATNIQNPTLTGITSQTNYTVSITTSNGCTVSGSVNVNLLDAPTITLNATPTSVCPGNSTQLGLTVNSGAGIVANTITNSAIITVTDDVTGLGNPYPALVTASGLVNGASVKSVSVNGITHTYPADIDLVLVSPSGQAITIMSDCGGSVGITNRNLVFQDGSPALTTSTITSGTYSPTNLGSVDDVYPSPGPGTIPLGSLPLSTFTGDLNGVWQLYVYDDTADDFGNINNGFAITFNNPTGVSYSWTRNTSGTISTSTAQNPTAIVNTQTTFSATVTNTTTGCSTTQSINVGIAPTPQPKLTQASQSLCSGGEVFIGVVDTGSFAGGYPLNTKVDWYGAGNNVLATNLDVTATISSNLSTSFYAVVKLPDNSCTGTSNVITISTVQISVTATASNATCIANSGSITATATGVGPFTYIWKDNTNTVVQTTTNSALTTNVLSGLMPGNYSVTVTGNSDGSNTTIPTCTSSPTSVTVGSIPPLSVNVSSTSQSCPSNNDGIASAILSDGVGPYTYNWNDGAYSLAQITGLAPGVYSVTVTDLTTGCIASGTTTVNAALAITFNISTTNVTCNGLLNGSASVDFIGSTANVIAYEWQDAAFSSIVSDVALTNVGAGTYYVYALDENGCNSLSNAVIIAEPAAVNISSFTPSNGIVGASVVITGSGFTGATAVFFNGVAASFVVDNSNTITATVPTGATNGNISVTVNGICTTVSTTPFTVNASTVTLNLNAFIQGFYLGSGLMPAILFDQGMETDPTACDYITVELYEALTPSNPVVNTTSTILHTDGTAQITLPSTINGGDYYIVIKHRNTIETWSKNPVTFTSVTNFDFTQ